MKEKGSVRKSEDRCTLAQLRTLFRCRPDLINSLIRFERHGELRTLAGGRCHGATVFPRMYAGHTGAED